MKKILIIIGIVTLLLISSVIAIEWEENIEYRIGDIVTYKDSSYECIFTHNSTDKINPKDKDYWEERTISNDLKNELKTYLKDKYDNKELKDWDVVDVMASTKVIVYDITLQNKNTGETKNITWFKSLN